MFHTKNSKITVYGLATVDTPNTYLTFVLKKKQLKEYLKRITLIEHFEHYKAWCNLKEYDIDDVKSQELYFKTCIEPSELDSYIIKKLSYRVEDIVGILRMFGNCLPLGCTFELPYEDLYFKSKFEDLEDIKTDSENPLVGVSEVENGSK